MVRRRTWVPDWRRIGVVALVVCWPALLLAQEPTATVKAPLEIKSEVNPKQVTIGEPFRYTVTVTAQKETEVVIPVLSGQIGKFSIVDFGEGPASDQGGQVTASRWYTLTVWESGDQLVPAPKIFYRVPGGELTEADGEETLIGVTSLLGPDPNNAQLSDVSAPEEPPFDWRPYGLAAAALAVLLMIGAGFYYVLNRPKRARAIPPRPAHEVALEALNHLRAQRLIEDGRFEDYYVGLSAVVRRYLEDGFTLRAPEMTTEEFLAAASGDRRLQSNHRRSLGDFLSQADLVKFARHLPSLQDAETAYEAARRFIEETRPRDEHPEEKPSAAA